MCVDLYGVSTEMVCSNVFNDFCNMNTEVLLCVVEFDLSEANAAQVVENVAFAQPCQC